MRRGGDQRIPLLQRRVEDSAPVSLPIRLARRFGAQSLEARTVIFSINTEQAHMSQRPRVIHVFERTTPLRRTAAGGLHDARPGRTSTVSKPRRTKFRSLAPTDLKGAGWRGHDCIRRRDLHESRDHNGDKPYTPVEGDRGRRDDRLRLAPRDHMGECSSGPGGMTRAGPLRYRGCV